MKHEFTEIIERHLTKERIARNEALRMRLNRDKTFEDMLAELASLNGFNKEERALAAMRQAAPEERTLATA